MKQLWIVAGSLALICTGCESKAGSGALIGGGSGAIIGGAIGGSWQGAAIGMAAGAVTGALVGHAMDEHDKKVMQQNAPDTMNRIENGQQLYVTDIESMHNNGLSDEVIINQIHATKSVFHLSVDQINDLKHQGISDAVINAMIQTGNR
jgi:outer membrane lipoprotein SlyB